ncbi:hypothetical protein [Rubinisphaera italica]|uniref:Signal peptide prediction n=1 Tax=Rubinisphaera italica TaxID=2527969 RepID=A0A5C5XGR9_9PLAN|nr:hypothetical protein [Rubinisphaera italica]TWT61899.1 hypothetical protein Pan54_26360 [Rubinisphaera italica]
MIIQILKWIWVSPWSLVGLVIGLISCSTGGSGRRVDHTLEFQGGLACWLLERTPIGAIAITVGHVILARNQAALDFTRNHERVHVKQYEKWGPLFVPAYFLLSGIVWMRGGKAYRDNPFEVEAFAIDDPHNHRPIV